MCSVRYNEFKYITIAFIFVMKKLIVIAVFVFNLFYQSNAIRFGLFNGDFKGWSRGPPIGTRRSYRPIWINYSPVVNHNIYHGPKAPSTPSALKFRAKLLPNELGDSCDETMMGSLVDRKAVPIEPKGRSLFRRLIDTKSILPVNKFKSTISSMKQRSSIDLDNSGSQYIPNTNVVQNPKELIKSKLVQNVVQSLPEFNDPGEELKFYVQLRKVLQNIKQGVVSREGLKSATKLQPRKINEAINPLLIGRPFDSNYLVRKVQLEKLVPKRSSWKNSVLRRPVSMLGSASNGNVIKVPLFENKNRLIAGAANRQNMLAKFKELVLRILSVLQELYRE